MLVSAHVLRTRRMYGETPRTPMCLILDDRVHGGFFSAPGGTRTPNLLIRVGAGWSGDLGFSSGIGADLRFSLRLFVLSPISSGCRAAQPRPKGWRRTVRIDSIPRQAQPE